MRKKIVIRPLIREKFQEFLQGQRILFFSAPCGFGKTTVAEALLSGRAVLRRSGEDEDPIPEEGDWNILLVDDFQRMPEENVLALCQYIRSTPDRRFVFLSRGVPPGCMMAFQYAGIMGVISAQEMLFDEEDIQTLFRLYDVPVTRSEVSGILKESIGYQYLTQAMVELADDDPEGALLTLAPLESYCAAWITEISTMLEAGANPTYAGTYILYATWTGETNYTTASLSLAVTIQKAAQTANITVVNETISGKGDGGVKLLPSAEGYEIREKGETTFEPIEASQGQTFVTLTPGVTYEIRLAETKNYLPTAPQEVTVQPGRKLKVTLPDKQEGYTLTASKTQLDWHDDVVLSFQLNPVGAYKAADFGVWKQEGSSKIGLPLGTGGAVTLNDVSNDITITVTGVKTDDVAPKVYIQGRMPTDGFSDLTQPLDRIQEETIRKSDRATLDEVEATLKGLDVTYAFEQEKKEIQDKLAEIARLRAVLDQVAAVEAQIDALPDSVEPYQQTVEDTQIKPARKAYSDLTDHQKTLVDSTKLDKLVRLEAQLDAWTITEGDGQIWYKGSGKSLSFTVNGQSRKFDGIRQGSTYIGSGVSSLLTASGEMDKPFTLTLKPEFLQCQTPGEHSFAVWYSGLYSGYLSISVTYTVETPANYLDVTDREEFEGKTTVTVDGKEYPIEEMAGYLQRIPTQRYVNLPETGDLLTIYSFKDGTPTGSYTNYPTGMQVFRITRQEGGAKAEEITEFANLLNYAGCSIRVSGKKGIRMITGIDQNVKKSLVSKAGLAGYTLEEYGTVVQWADTLGSNTLNLDNSNKKNYAYKKGKADPIFAKENGMIQYTNVLVGFTDAQCQPDLVMRPYIKLIDTATGETVTLYGGSVTRSIGYVAWQNRDTYKQGTASYKYVWNIINSVDTSKYPN